MSPITDRLAVEFIDKERAILTRDLHYIHSVYGAIVVPKGFVSDFDSVPRLPLAYVLVKNTSKTGAVVHDWLYKQGQINGEPITRKEADQIFDDVMKDEGVWWWRRALIYRGVRLGGWIPWNRYREEDNNQEPGFV